LWRTSQFGWLRVRPPAGVWCGRCRRGQHWQRLSLYGQKGGDTLEQFIWDEQVKAGLIADGGIEYAFTKHFVGRGEYLYANYGSVALSSRDRTRTEFRNKMHLVRVGASYRF
jgi:opacity protein-like surface antigen